MLKFIHTADLHLGARYLFLEDKALARYEEHKKVWHLIVDKAIQKEVDFVLIAGDVFDSNQVGSSVVEDFVSGLSRLNDSGIEVIVVPGTHDPYLKGRGVLSDPRVFPKMKLLWNQGSTITLKSKDGDLVHLYGLGFDGYTDLKDVLQGVKRKYLNGIHIASLHCSLIANPDWKYRAVDFPVEMQDLVAMNMDYVALGHYHDKRIIEKSGKIIAAYPGSPDGVKFSETGDKYIFSVEISSNKNIKIEELKSNYLVFENKEISVSGIDELKSFVAENKNPFSAMKLVVKGFVPQLTEIEDKGYFFLKIIDQTLPFDLNELQHQYAAEKTIRGEFINSLLKDMNDNNRELYLDIAKEVLVRLGDI